MSAYEELKPYSKKYIVDQERYLFSLNLILKRIPHLHSKKILDIGTGIGLMPLAIKKLGLDVAGLDYFIFPESDNKMFGLTQIEKIQEIWKKNGITVFNSNIYASELPKDLSHIDVIISEATIEHLKDPKRFLDTCHALLNPGGYLLITTPNIATLLKRIRFLFGKSPMWPINEFYASGETFTGHWREYTQDELEYMCKQSGFSLLKSYNKNLLTRFKEIRAWRKNLRAAIVSLSSATPKGREMLYVLCQKNPTST